MGRFEAVEAMIAGEDQILGRDEAVEARMAHDIEAQEEEDGEVVAYPVDELRPPSSSVNK